MNPLQKSNLIILKDYLYSLPEDYEHFDMDYFFAQEDGFISIKDITPSLYTRCGTAACALGHGIAAGVDPDGSYSWEEYSLNQFGLHYDCIEWDWCFSDAWRRVSNTLDPNRRGIGQHHWDAAKRIERFIESDYEFTEDMVEDMGRQNIYPYSYPYS